MLSKKKKNNFDDEVKTSKTSSQIKKLSFLC